MSVDQLTAPPRAAPIDPRIRERRITVRRDEGRRRLRRLIAFGVALLLIVVGVAAIYSPLLDIDHLETRGNGITTAGEIFEAAGISRGEPIARVDIGASTTGVEALPWVATARVHRELPGTVLIEITERTAVAVLRSVAGEEVLVDAGGRVLGSLRPGTETLPRVVLDGALPPAGGRVERPVVPALDVAAVAGDAVAGHTLLVSATPEGDIALVVDAVFDVRFGRPDRVAAKLRSLATVLREVDLTCVATIDVRSDERPVLTREDSCQ